MGKTFWLVSISSDNSDKTFSSGFNMQGFDKKSRKKVDVMAPDDRLLYYINDKRVFSATATVTSSMFEDKSIIWTSHDEKETFPYRVHTKKDLYLEYDGSVDGTYVAPSLEYLRKWPANRWELAFFGMLHIIPQNDFNFIEIELERLLKKNKNIKKKKNNKPKAITKGISRDILRKNNKELNRGIKSRFKI